MRHLISLFSLILAMLTANVAPAQTNTGKLHGRVGDAGRAAINAATITLLKAKDSSIVKMSAAGKDGRFEFNNVPAGKYLLLASAVGYNKTYSKPLEVTGTGAAIEVEPLILNTQSKDLASVTVSARKPLVEHKIDRMVVNVDASITSAGSTALDVLEKSPGVEVDKDGNISLKGKSGVMVLVDGRQTYLSGPDLANLLRNMPANQLEQIEIMTNPPAKFDASGNSGVLNIKTKKNKQFGYNGSFNLGYNQGRYPKSNESFNFNYRNQKVNVFTSLSHNYNNNFGNLNIQRRFRDSTTKELKTHFDQQNKRRNWGQFYSARVGMDYFAGKNTTLGFVLNGFTNNNSNRNINSTGIAGPAGDPISETNAFQNSEGKWKNFSANVNFRHVFDTTGKELTADLDYSSYDSKNNMSLINAFYDAGGNPSEKGDTLYGGLPQHINIYSARVDYLHPMKKGARFEAGIKSSIVRTDANAIYDSVTYGEIVHDYGRSNHFIYEENINAAYVNLNKPINKKWGAQLGLRLENTNAKGTQMTTGEQFTRNYTQLFPTAYVQYTLNDKNNFVLNYGRRIRRPDYQSLNPFINFLDRYTFERGNPNLKPQFSHNIELSHNFRGFINTTLNYSRTTDIIQDVLEQNAEKNETFVNKKNIANQQQFGLAVNVSNSFTKWWKGNVYINAYNNRFRGLVNNELITVSGNTFSLNGNQTFTFAKTWSAEVGGFYRSRGIEGVLITKSMWALNAGIGKQILKGKGTVRVNVRDIFYTQRFGATSKYSNVDVAFQQNRDSRQVGISFSYRFAKGKMNNTPKRRNNGSSEEQNRVGVGGN
jgi:iron complex outermembrane receptor protein